jgi:hypothetical protein
MSRASTHAFIKRAVRRKPYVLAALLLAAVAVGGGYLAAGSANPHHHLIRRGNHAPDYAAYVAAIEAKARRAIAPVTVTGSLMDAGFPVIVNPFNPVNRIGTPMTTDGGSREGPGRFELAFTCAGHGKLEATLSVGEAASHMMASCGPQTVPISIYLDAHRAGLLFVQFAARGRETVAVAYKLASRVP